MSVGENTHPTCTHTHTHTHTRHYDQDGEAGSVEGEAKGVDGQAEGRKQADAICDWHLQAKDLWAETSKQPYQGM